MTFKSFNFKDPKTILYITILVVVLAIIAKYVIQKLTKSNNDKLLDKVENDINTNQLSYTDGEFSIMADELETAMRGTGHDLDLIKKVFNQLKTKSDWFKLISTFGIRPFGNWFYTHEGTLINWLDDEYFLSSTKADFNKILSKINVTI